MSNSVPLHWTLSSQIGPVPGRWTRDTSPSRSCPPPPQKKKKTSHVQNRTPIVAEVRWVLTIEYSASSVKWKLDLKNDSNVLRRIKTLDLPKAEHVTDDLRCSVVEIVITHSSPYTVVKNFQTSFVYTRTSCQSHCKTTYVLLWKYGNMRIILYWILRGKSLHTDSPTHKKLTPNSVKYWPI